MSKPQSRYAAKGRGYDYSHLFKDCSENDRVKGHFLWTHELKQQVELMLTVGLQ